MSAFVVSVLMLWSGDFSARLQFDGSLKNEIKGELVEDSSVKSEKSCEVYAVFDQVLLKQKSTPEKYLKINFKFICTQDGQKKTHQLAPEFIRESDLKNLSSSVFISQKFKKSSFKIENFAIQNTKSKK